VAGVIRHEEDGLLARCGDVEELSAALVRLAEDAGLRRRFGAAGRKRLCQDFRWEDKLALVRQVYEEVGGRTVRDGTALGQRAAGLVPAVRGQAPPLARR
jgi:glycosyltransferase involved in cell wall biosynthesis